MWDRFVAVVRFYSAFMGCALLMSCFTGACAFSVGALDWSDPYAWAFRAWTSGFNLALLAYPIALLLIWRYKWREAQLITYHRALVWVGAPLTALVGLLMLNNVRQKVLALLMRVLVSFIPTTQ